MASGRTKKVLLIQPRTTHRGGINFELVSILRLGLPILAGSLRDYKGEDGSIYEPLIWLEDRSGPLSLDFVDQYKPDALIFTGLVNEIPRGFDLSNLLRREFPDIPQAAGGPHMGALPGEALYFGSFDVVGHNQGTRYVGTLMDILTGLKGQERLRAFKKIPGLSFNENGRMVTTAYPIMSKSIPESPTPLPNYDAIYGLSKESPLPAISMQLSDSCPYRCTFCRVWTHNGRFVQFKSVTQRERWEQARDLQDKGLVIKDRTGKTPVFIVDDLAAWGLPLQQNLPPGMTMAEFKQLRDSRLNEYKSWNDMDFMGGFYTIAQVRAAHGDDREMIDAMISGARNKMCYVGIESSDDENLIKMNKQQRVADIERQVHGISGAGVDVVGMGIIGLPNDTHSSVMKQAHWFKERTKLSTVNYITHLWGTADAKFTQFRLLSEDGRVVPMVGYDNEIIEPPINDEDLGKIRVLRPAEMLPYHRFTGRWSGFKDINEERNWSPEYTNKLVEDYYSVVHSPDVLYKRGAIQAGVVKWLNGKLVPVSLINEVTKRLPTQASQAGHDIAEAAKRLPGQAQEIAKAASNLTGRKHTLGPI